MLIRKKMYKKVEQNLPVGEYNINKINKKTPKRGTFLQKEHIL